jgi:hypothetical protein
LGRRAVLLGAGIGLESDFNSFYEKSVFVYLINFLIKEIPGLPNLHGKNVSRTQYLF